MRIQTSRKFQFTNLLCLLFLGAVLVLFLQGCQTPTVVVVDPGPSEPYIQNIDSNDPEVYEEIDDLFGVEDFEYYECADVYLANNMVQGIHWSDGVTEKTNPLIYSFDTDYRISTEYNNGDVLFTGGGNFYDYWNQTSAYTSLTFPDSFTDGSGFLPEPLSTGDAALVNIEFYDNPTTDPFANIYIDPVDKLFSDLEIDFFDIEIGSERLSSSGNIFEDVQYMDVSSPFWACYSVYAFSLENASSSVLPSDPFTLVGSQAVSQKEFSLVQKSGVKTPSAPVKLRASRFDLVKEVEMAESKRLNKNLLRGAISKLKAKAKSNHDNGVKEKLNLENLLTSSEREQVKLVRTLNHKNTSVRKAMGEISSSLRLVSSGKKLPPLRAEQIAKAPLKAVSGDIDIDGNNIKGLIQDSRLKAEFPDALASMMASEYNRSRAARSKIKDN